MSKALTERDRMTQKKEEPGYVHIEGEQVELALVDIKFNRNPSTEERNQLLIERLDILGRMTQRRRR